MNEAFKAQLLDTALNHIRQKSIPINPVISNVIRNVISEGIEKMRPADFVDDSRKQLAQRNLIVLLDAFIQDNRGHNEGFETRSFSRAKTTICPLWPFC